MDSDQSINVDKAATFKDTLQALIAENYNKRMAEKANLMEKATLLLELKEVQKALLEDSSGGWRRTLQAIGSLARMECDENVKKLSMSTRSFKSSAFNLWKSALNLQLNTPSSEVRLGDLTSTLSKCFSENSKVWPLVDASVWLDTIGLLSSVFNMYSTSDIPFSGLLPIWKICISRLRKSISDDKRSERQKLSELFEILTRSLRCTQLHLQIEGVIQEFKGMIDNYSWPGKDPAKTNFLDVLNNLCSSYGFEQRDLLLTSFFPIADKLHIHMNIFSPSLGQNQSFDVIQLGSERVGTFQNSFYKFIEHVFVMSVPDCELNSFNYEPVFPMAQKCLYQIIEEVAEHITKSASVFRPTAKCVIPAAKLPLIARLFIITHLKYKHSSTRGVSTEDRPRPKKRAKKSPSQLFDILLHSTALAHFQILLEVLRTWKHRIDQETAESITQALMKINRNFVREDDRLVAFLKILTELVCFKTEAMVLEEVFNWALPLLHNPAAHNAVCFLITTILSTVDESSALRKKFTFEVVVNNISRLHIFQSGTLQLIQFLVASYDFDESFLFRISELKMDDVGKEWCFRSQLISSLLSCSEPDLTLDLSDLLLSLVTYMPNSVCKLDEEYNNCKSELNYSDLLTEFHCSERPFPSSKNNVLTKNETEFPIQVIDCLLIVCAKSIETILRLESTEVEKKFQMWRISTILQEKLQMCECSTTGCMRGTQMLLDQFFVNSDIFAGGNFKLADAYELLNIGKFWDSASLQIKQFVEGAANSGLSLLYRFVVHWSKNISDNVLKSTLENFEGNCSPAVEDLLLTITDNVSFFDLLRILQRFGPKLLPSNLMYIFENLMKRIEEQTLNNSAENISPSQETVKRAFFSTNRRELNDGQQALWKSLAAHEILRVLNCSSLHNLCLHVVDERWLRLSKFLVENTQSKMLAIRFGFLYPTPRHMSRAENCFRVLSARIRAKSHDQFVFLKNCLNDESLHSIRPEIFKELLLCFPYVTCIEFINNFEERYQQYGDVLAYLFNIADEKCFDAPEVDRFFAQKLSQPFVRYLLDPLEPLQISHSPGIFGLPRKMLLELTQRSNFAGEWLSLFREGNCGHIFYSLRKHIYQWSTAVQKALIAPVVLNAIMLLFKNFQWNSLPKHDIAFTIIMDIFSICRVLLSQFIGSPQCSDFYLQDLYDRWFYFVSKTAETEFFFPRIHLLALQSVDSLIDFRLHYPVTWQFLTLCVTSLDENNSALMGMESCDGSALHMNFVREYSQCFLETNVMEELSDSLGFYSNLSILSNTASQDLTTSAFDVVMLRGYWKHVQRSDLNQDLCESKVFLLCRLHFFCPWLRAEIAPLISLYPSSETKKVQEALLRSLCSKGSLSEFVVQISRILLFRSSAVCPPLVSAALYNCVSKSLVDDCGNALIKKISLVSSADFNASNANENVVVNAYDLILFLQKSRCVAAFPQELQDFIHIARHYPIYATLLIPHVVKGLAGYSNEKQCRTVIDELNVSIKALESKQTEFNEVENLFLIAIVSLAESWLVSMPHLSILSLVRCLVKAKLYRNAHYFLRYYLDFFFCNLPSRTMFHFQTEEEDKHFLETVKDEQLREELLKLLVQIFIGTNDPVPLTNIPLSAKINTDARIFIAESNHDWGALSGLCGSTFENEAKMIDAFYHLGSENIQNCSVEAHYASVIKLASWDQLSVASNQISFPKSAQTHWQSIYRAIKLFNDKKRCAIESSLTCFAENFKQSKHHLLDLSELDQLRDFVILNHHARAKTSEGQRTITLGQSSLAILCSWEMARNNSEHGKHLPALMNTVIKRSRELRKLRSYQPALRLLDKLEKIVQSSSCPHFLPITFLERAKVLIASKESSSSLMAGYFLKRVIHEFDTAAVNVDAAISVDDFDSLNDANETSLLKIKSYVLLSRISPNDEKSMKNLKEACKQSTAFTEKYPGMCSKNFVKYAIFAEKRYWELREFSETPAFALKKEAISQWQAEIDLSNLKGSNASKGETCRREREIECEKVDVKAVEDERNTYLRESSKYYLNALVLGSLDSGCSDAILIHRFAALLMQNVDDEELSRFSMNYVDRIPSCVWVPIFNILSSYLFSTGFPIAGLVSKVVRDYPYHCLNDLLFYLSSSDSRKKLTLALFKKVCEFSPRLKEIIAVAKRAHDVLRDFAKTDHSHFETFSERGKQFYKISARQKIMSELSTLQSVPIPVLTQKLTKAGDYDVGSLVSFQHVQNTFELADGLSTPKVIVVTGSDGVKYKLIFKKEDIRQDGLIQQLFLVSNLLMQNSKVLASVAKSFKPLRQYNVLPLDGQNGIIEWCQDTQSICGYLAGNDKKGGAHLKYRPKEPSVYDLRCELSKLDLSRPDRCKEFLAMCNKISPVFRYFFYEKFNKLEIFHQRLDAYTRSLAQWSAVCYVVGLGDRHLTNILIDEEGELVHIDLGQVFEYSKRMLKQPEKVPFRLTREMVDPILLDGVHGKLKSIACETLKTMRDNAQVLIGISSLILYDPISSLKSKLSLDKKMDKAQRNLFAECAISRLKEKLAGRDLTYAEMNAEEQMTRLISDARNPENLCQMFAGWLAFL